MKHATHSELLTRRVAVALVGCGGTGSMVLSGLARLHLSMLALAHPGGLSVCAFDPDNVSDSNVGRQLFWPADVGNNKAIVLINRLNIGYGLQWKAEPSKYEDDYRNRFDIVICCVDTRESRREISKAMPTWGYCIDCGNGSDFGQVFIGETVKTKKTALPLPWVACPELIAEGVEDNTPSCSLAEALGSQELFINQAVATCALQLLWSLFRHGGLNIRGYYINAKNGRTIPVPV